MFMSIIIMDALNFGQTNLSDLVSPKVWHFECISIPIMRSRFHAMLLCVLVVLLNSWTPKLYTNRHTKIHNANMWTLNCLLAITIHTTLITVISDGCEMGEIFDNARLSAIAGTGKYFEVICHRGYLAAGSSTYRTVIECVNGTWNTSLACLSE